MEWIIERFSEPILIVLIDSLLKGSLIASAIIVLTSVLGTRSTRLRSLLLNIGLVALLQVPALSLGWHFQSMATQPGVRIEGLPALQETASTRAISPIPIPIEVDHGSMTLIVIASLYGLGFLAAGVRVAGSILGLFRLNQTLVPITNTALTKQMERAQTRLGVHKTVGLFRSARIDSPCQMGVIKLAIVLPADRDFPADALDTIFLHELIHIKHHDCLFKVLGSICLAFHWYNPLVWVIVNRSGRIQDQVCDDWVVYLQKSPERYVETLISVVRGFRTPGSFTYQFDMAQGSGLLERIRRIREVTSRHPSLGSSGYTVSVTSTLAGLLIAGFLRVSVSSTEAVTPATASIVATKAVESPVKTMTPRVPAAQPLTRRTSSRPPLVRPQVEILAVQDEPDEPDAWFGRAVMASASAVEPLQVSAIPTKHRVTNNDVMLYPEPSPYADLAANNRLIAPAGATYHTQLTMGRVMGTEFQREFFTGNTFGSPEERAEYQRETEARKSGGIRTVPTPPKKEVKD